jgi:methylenetetrahydrofolate dehydrogenase (NADP+) / methenyltetrahydrofolate cyclohydrolase
MAQLLDGKATAAGIRAQLKTEIAALRAAGAAPPHSVFIQVGDNPASTTYVNTKHKMAGQVGIESSIERLPADISQAALLARISELNADPQVHAILTQLPLPPQIEEQAVEQAISPAKDVDCFHPENVGRLALGLPGPKPATPQGVLMLLDAYGIDVTGLNAVVVGRSNLVGKPLGLMLLARHATVTFCHTRTRDLAGECRRADLLIAAGGRARLITGEMVKPGAIVVDVGTNYVPVEEIAREGAVGAGLVPASVSNAERADTRSAPTEQPPVQKLVGDVAFDEVEPIASWISPVPGGVGPMTIASVLYNALVLYKSARP